MNALNGLNRPQAFGLDEAQEQILDQADRYAETELYPLSRRMDDEEWWPDEAFRNIGASGYFGATIPEQYGGAGMDLLTAGLVLQGFSRWNHALALSVVAHDNLCANNIYRNGNEEQRPALSARPLRRADDRRAGSDRTGGRVRRARLHADHGPARR